MQALFVRRAAPLASLAVAVASAHAQQVQTTLDDFFVPGTQPNSLVDPMLGPVNCTGCHSDYNEETEPYSRWTHSMMGQAGRDPIFYAALAVANNDVKDVGELCLRCHAPAGWLNGNSVPTDGSAITASERSGVSCHVCHRMVDPVYTEGESPSVDQAILDALETPVINPHSASMVIDPLDRRRGPLDLEPFFVHQWLESPYHRSSSMCATCHEVSNPAYSRQPDGTYALNALGERPPSDDKYDQFPVERTYSEWLMSDFALGPIDMDGRFGGTLQAVSTCQDCHMPQITGQICSFGPGRPDIRQHNFNGANTWVLRAINELYPPLETGLSPDLIEEAIDRNKSMLQRSGDLDLFSDGDMLTVRITNQTGHKLPTGYVEGRRMWVNVVFLDGEGMPVEEFGAYDFQTAVLDTDSTKVYEGKLGISQEIADATGVPVGEGFHFALNNVWEFDNRIPPRGFTNANFEAIQAAPVGYTYADGQYWDDTLYPIPEGAKSAEVRVYFQTTTKEYIEFLRDHGGTAGQTAYDVWLDPEIGNKSEPFVMFEGSLPFGSDCVADFDLDGDVDLTDFGTFGSAFNSSNLDGNYNPDADFDGDGDVDLTDFGTFGADFNRTDC